MPGLFFEHVMCSFFEHVMCSYTWETKTCCPNYKGSSSSMTPIPRGSSGALLESVHTKNANAMSFKGVRQAAHPPAPQPFSFDCVLGLRMVLQVQHCAGSSEQCHAWPLIFLDSVGSFSSSTA